MSTDKRSKLHSLHVYMFIRGIASSTQVKGPQYANYLKCEPRHRNYTKSDKTDGGMALLGPIVTMPVHVVQII